MEQRLDVNASEYRRGIQLRQAHERQIDCGTTGVCVVVEAEHMPRAYMDANAHLST